MKSMRRHGDTIKTKLIKRKCTGFYGHRTIKSEIYHTGTSYFATITAKQGDYSNTVHVLEIRKHFPFERFNLWDAKRFVRFIIKNFPDYLTSEWQNK